MSATPYPFAYLDASALERRLDVSAAIRGQLGASDSEWSDLLDDVIDEETAWVHGVITAEGVYPDQYADRSEFLAHYPQVRRAMVRLCRASIHEIEQDGLESESAEDRSESYRSPKAVRDEVRAELEALAPPDETGDADPDFRASLI